MGVGGSLLFVLLPRGKKERKKGPFWYYTFDGSIQHSVDVEREYIKFDTRCIDHRPSRSSHPPPSRSFLFKSVQLSHRRDNNKWLTKRYKMTRPPPFHHSMSNNKKRGWTELPNGDRGDGKCRGREEGRKWWTMFFLYRNKLICTGVEQYYRLFPLHFVINGHRVM